MSIYLLRPEKLLHLLEKFAIPSKVARRQLLLHLAEDAPHLLKRVTGRFCVQCLLRCDSRANEELFSVSQCAGPLDLAVIGKELA